MSLRGDGSVALHPTSELLDLATVPSLTPGCSSVNALERTRARLRRSRRCGDRVGGRRATDIRKRLAESDADRDHDGRRLSGTHRGEGQSILRAPRRRSIGAAGLALARLVSQRWHPRSRGDARVVVHTRRRIGDARRAGRERRLSCQADRGDTETRPIARRTVLSPVRTTWRWRGAMLYSQDWPTLGAQCRLYESSS